MRVSLLPQHIALAHKPARAHLLLAAVVAAALPILGLCYLSGILWSRSISTSAADVVASQRLTLGRPAFGAVPLAAAGAGPDTTNTSCQAVLKPIPPPQTRQDIAHLLQQEGFEVGAELGVQHGVFAAETLWAWKGCKRYYLIDPYSHQQQHIRSQEALQQSAQQGRVMEDQEDILQQAQENLQGWQQKLVWLRNSTKEAGVLIREPLDYVYVDARKDFCGVMEDLTAWWPMVKPGGIMAGYSFGNAADIMRNSGQDWSRCADSTTVHHGAVQAAVNEFFDQQGLQVVVTYRERQGNSWLVRKPHYPCSSQQPAGAAAAQGQQEEPLTQLLSMMLQQAPQDQPPSQQQQQQQRYEGQIPQQEQQQQQQQNSADDPRLVPEQGTGIADQEVADEAQGGHDVQQQQQQQQQQHISDHQEPEERKQQLKAALLKLHDSKSLAVSRSEQEATPGAGEVFGDILSAQEEAR